MHLRYVTQTSFLYLVYLAAIFALAACTTPRLLQPPVTGPYETKAVDTSPPVPQPDPRAAFVPEGFRVEVVAKDLIYPTSVDFDKSGNMYIAEAGFVYGDHWAPARILRISPQGQVKAVAQDGLKGPVTDILWHQDQLFISHSQKISTLTQGGELRDIVTDLPSLGDHHNNQMTLGPDGRLYFGQGTATNSGVVGMDNFLFLWLPVHPRFHDKPAHKIRLIGKTFLTANPFFLGNQEKPKTATTGAFSPFGEEVESERIEGALKANGTILSVNPDGSDLQVYAWGLRNPFGAMWSPNGRLYVAENGYDERGSRPIANALDNIHIIKKGAWYGWPDYSSGLPVTDERFEPKEGPKPEFLMAEHPPVEKPFMTRPAHAGVTKMEFSPGGPFGYKGHMFLAEWGDMNPLTGQTGERAGYQVVRINPETKAAETFFRTKPEFLGPKEHNREYVLTSGPKRMMDVRFSPRGEALYVVDLGAFTVPQTTVPIPQPTPASGVIWRITRADSNKAPLGTSKVISLKPGAHLPDQDKGN